MFFPIFLIIQFFGSWIQADHALSNNEDEDIDCAIALSLSEEENKKGKEVGKYDVSLHLL